jgi:hypothetical protein
VNAHEFAGLVAGVMDAGYDDAAWAESVGPPTSADEFAREAIYVICNSGMRFTIARGIFERVMPALAAGESARSQFGHPGKAAAIDQIWYNRGVLFAQYLLAPDKVEFCGGLPWVGETTKYHLAKNFGADVAKPDVHLQRLAEHYGTTPQELCARIASETGYRAATVDVVLWRACAIGLIDSRAL